MAHRVDVAAAVEDLVASMVAQPWGQVSASGYETGRLVVLAPGLAGQAERLDHLVATQNRDGSWGAPDGYALVPTLSATDALLCALDRDRTAIAGTRSGREALAHAADRGLLVLFGGLAADEGPVPDMPARELITAALIGAVNARLDSYGTSTTRLRRPGGPGPERLAALTELVAAGAALDVKLLHALEVTGPAARGSATARPTPVGAVGASPAATAAWLGANRVTDPSDPSARYLATAVELGGGSVGCTTPITVFERAWVLATLARSGLVRPLYPHASPEPLSGLVESLRSELGHDGAATGPGLPTDADTTAMTLEALALLGDVRDPACLLGFRTGSSFCTWPGEQGVSTTVNAHVLGALGAVVAARPDLAPVYRPVMATVATWLTERQSEPGWWRDRWHASDYYATYCCALALHDASARPGAGSGPVRRAVRWVLETQRADGAWGRWGPSTEETAYAVLTLLLRPSSRAVAAAVRAAYPHLVAGLHDPVDRAPALWHDKDLYRPHAIVRAFVLAAIDACQSSTDAGRGRNRNHRTGGPMRRTQSLRTTTDRC
jgi:Squalene-hopene cyclase C-terminal domain